ncbi:mycofactocin-associated electron transfer flavoprotein beta subunit [Saccharopolyspora shandongensis]|uniref:mycofactocin-associated electron transfer flavoprotein beta subunit n=1 Tax=Saccharopolyspora shandongensis TaxID=418495 RepID=UPI0033CEAE75
MDMVGSGGPVIVAALKWSWLRASVDPLTGSVQVGVHDTGVSAADEAALEHALRLAGRWSGRVVAVTCGPPEADAALRAALAAGAAEALRVDAAAPDASALVGNGRQVARSLAVAVRRRYGVPALTLCGDRSVDRGTGTVPGFLAAEFGAAQALGVVRLEPGEVGDLLVHRRLDHGRREVLQVNCPAVVSVEAAGVRLRRASLPAVLSSRSGEITVVKESSAATASPRMLAQGPRRPRTHAIEPPAGNRPQERLVELTGAFQASTSARVVGPLPASEAVDELLGYLRGRGYLSESDGSRP